MRTASGEKRRRAAFAALIVVGGLALPVPLSATVSNRVLRQYSLVKAALQAELKKPCATPEEISSLARQARAAMDALDALSKADDKQLEALKNREPGGVSTPTPKMVSLQRDIDALDEMFFELQGLLMKLFAIPRCVPPPTPPPPPPPPNPGPPNPPGPPPSTPRVTKQPHHRSTSCPDCQALADALNETSDSLIAAEEKGAPNQEAILAEVERLGEELNACEKKCTKPATTSTAMRNPLLIGGVTAGVVATTVLLTHRGGSGTPPAVVSTAPPFLPFSGTLRGPMQLVPDAKTCPGSNTDYDETAVASISLSRSGTLQLQAAFARMYNVVLDASNSFTDNETFPFFGGTVPAIATGTFVFTNTSSATLTLQETTTYGSCANTYRGQLK